MKLKSKKLTAWILFVGMMAVNISSVSAGANYFSDTRGHWAEGAIVRLSSLGVINGYGGKFLPEDAITRSEAAMILKNLMGYLPQDTSKADAFFDDLGEKWYTDACLAAYKAGSMQGYGRGEFRPEENITRQEAAAIIARSARISPQDGETNFKDEANIESWAMGYVKALADSGIMEGVNTKDFEPERYIKRSEIANIINATFSEIYNKEGDHEGEKVDGNVLITSADVFLDDMEISGNLIVSEGVDEGRVTINDTEVDGKMVIRGGSKGTVISGDSSAEEVVISRTDGKVYVAFIGDAAENIKRIRVESDDVTIAGVDEDVIWVDDSVEVKPVIKQKIEEAEEEDILEDIPWDAGSGGSGGGGGGDSKYEEIPLEPTVTEEPGEEVIVTPVETITATPTATATPIPKEKPTEPPTSTPTAIPTATPTETPKPTPKEEPPIPEPPEEKEVVWLEGVIDFSHECLKEGVFDSETMVWSEEEDFGELGEEDLSNADVFAGLISSNDAKIYIKDKAGGEVWGIEIPARPAAPEFEYPKNKPIFSDVLMITVPKLPNMTDLEARIIVNRDKGTFEKTSVWTPFAFSIANRYYTKEGKQISGYMFSLEIEIRCAAREDAFASEANCAGYTP